MPWTNFFCSSKRAASSDVWHARKVDDIVDIVAVSCSLKMTLLGVETAIFLERLVIRNAVLDSLPKTGNGGVSDKRSRGRSRSSGKKWIRLSAPGTECVFGEVEPLSSWRDSGLSKP